MERFETKYNLLNRVYSDPSINKTTKAVMQYLVALSNDAGCHPAVATIARAIKRSERTVQRHMRILEQHGYLVRKERFWRQEQLTNDYSFCLSVTEEKEKHVKRTGIPAKTTFRKREYLHHVYAAELSASEQLVLIYLVHKANRQGRVIKSKEAIVKDLHMSWRLVSRILCRLRERRMIAGYGRCWYVLLQLRPVDHWQDIKTGQQAEQKELSALTAGDICSKTDNRHSDRDNRQTSDIQHEPLKLILWVQNLIHKIKKWLHLLI